MTSAPGAAPRIILDLTAELSSLDRFLADPAHGIPLRGMVDFDGIATGAAASGTLSLFPTDRGEAMSYRLEFRDDEGREWRLSGSKATTTRSPRQFLRALTRLDGVMSTSSTSSGVAFSVSIGPRELTRLLTSIRGRGFTAPRRARTVARFVGFFARSAVGSRR